MPPVFVNRQWFTERLLAVWKAGSYNVAKIHNFCKLVMSTEHLKTQVFFDYLNIG